MGEHDFVGRLDRWCEVCGFPDRDGIHHRAAPKMGDSPAAPESLATTVEATTAPSNEGVGRSGEGPTALSQGTAMSELCTCTTIGISVLVAPECPVHRPAAPDRDAADVEFGCAGAEKSGEPVFMVRTKAARSVLTRNRALEGLNAAERKRGDQLWQQCENYRIAIEEHNKLCGELQAELLDAAIRYEYQMGGETAASMKWRALASLEKEKS